MDKISCVLCTYNGSEYIYDQLQSISHQSMSISELIVYDDVSSDDTVNILRKWKNENPNIITTIFVNEKNLGPATNFQHALGQSEGDYIFFCDQDDIWKTTKVEHTMCEMKRIEEKYGKDTPCLVHTDLEVVDRNLNTIAVSFLANQGLHHEYDKQKQIQTLLAQNFVTGCTMLINHPLKDLALPFPKNIIMHDYWLALVAASAGVLSFVDESTIKYRQHGNNTVGAKKYVSFDNFKKVFQFSNLLRRIDKVIIQDKELVAYKNGILIQQHPEIKKFINSVENRSVFSALFSSTHKQGILRDILYHIFLAIYAGSGRGDEKS